MNTRLLSFCFICCIFLNAAAQRFGPVGPSVSSRQCSTSNCRLPECYCPSRRGPSQLQTHDIPQMIMVTFDDAVNTENIGFYRKLLSGKRLNPNGCPVSATFFVSHDWTDYKMVRELYLAGHEIADHSISHRLPREWWRKASYRDWESELSGQRKNIASKAGVPKFEVRGVRVPFLELGGDTQFEVMADKGFLYDSSFLTGPYNDKDWRLPTWPYTLEFYPELEYCDSDNCPRANFSGIWEVPLNRWIGLDGQACSMVDGCNTQALQNKNDALRYLWKNFNRHYGKNRAPLGINIHADWFKVDYTFEAMQEFLDGILDLNDVYLVSVYQVIEWMRRPTSLSAISQFDPWLACGNKRVLVQKRKPTAEPKISSRSNSTDTSGDDRKRAKGGKRLRKPLERRRRPTEAPKNESSEEAQPKKEISRETPRKPKVMRGYKRLRTTPAPKRRRKGDEEESKKKQMMKKRNKVEKPMNTSPDKSQEKPEKKREKKVEEIEVKRVPSDPKTGDDGTEMEEEPKVKKPGAGVKGHRDPNILGKRGEFGNQSGRPNSRSAASKSTGVYGVITVILLLIRSL